MANQTIKMEPLKTNIRDCAGRGASVKFRIDEYQGLYNETPASDWWGHNFLQEKDDWWYVKLILYDENLFLH